jgi:hypothetical protein
MNLIAVLTLVPAIRVTPTTTTTISAERPGNCEVIVNELLKQGASSYVANRLGIAIATRESNCYPRQVHDNDDWSFSRFGLNGLTQGLRTTWRQWCNADVRWDTRILEVDVRCALAAYDHMGWQPWAI